jgi:hypothetical protein
LKNATCRKYVAPLSNNIGHLWGAATLLRGLIDASDYKQYIFPLLFFKRLSDVCDEDYQHAFEDTSDTGYAAATANDSFKIPEGAHWKDVRTASRDVGRALLNAFQAIEADNSERRFGDSLLNSAYDLVFDLPKTRYVNCPRILRDVPRPSTPHGYVARDCELSRKQPNSRMSN